MQRLHCLRCGHIWVPRINTPKKCPRCKNPPLKPMSETQLEQADLMPFVR